MQLTCLQPHGKQRNLSGNYGKLPFAVGRGRGVLLVACLLVHACCMDVSSKLRMGEIDVGLDCMLLLLPQQKVRRHQKLKPSLAIEY